MPGKEYAIVVRAAQSDENICFVARPFRSDFDAIYDAIQVAATRCNLKACTTSDFRNDKDFTQKFIRTIASAEIVVAVCSPVTNDGVFLANDNVMYELGMAHVLGKKTVILTNDAQHRPSDIGNRVFLKYSPKIEDQQNNIAQIEDAILKTRAGTPQFLSDILKDYMWTVEAVQYLFTSREFWRSFNIIINKLCDFLDDFSAFQAASVVSCKAELDEMLGQDVEKSVRLRTIFHNRWPAAFRNYETCVGSHVANLQSSTGNGIQEGFEKMIELADDSRIKRMLTESQEVWIKLVKEIMTCHECVVSFNKIATFNNIIIRYRETQGMLHEQFNSIESSVRNIHQNIYLLLRNFRKMFSSGE